MIVLPPLRALLLALALGALCAFAVACGEEQKGLISSTRAADIKAQLDNIDEDVASERCEGALRDHLAALRREINDLPGTVDRDLRRTLRDGLERLEDQAPAECAPEEPTTTTTETIPTTPTETIPPTDTAPPETTPTAPPETTPTAPPETTPTTPPETTPTPTPEQPVPDDSGGSEAPTGVNVP